MSSSLSVGPALLSLGLSTQDDNLPSSPARWVFTVLCSLFSSVQSGMISHMTRTLSQPTHTPYSHPKET